MHCTRSGPSSSSDVSEELGDSSESASVAPTPGSRQRCRMERLISNFPGTRISLLGLSYNLRALGQGSAEFFLKGQIVNILDSWAISLSQLFNPAVVA